MICLDDEFNPSLQRDIKAAMNLLRANGYRVQKLKANKGWTKGKPHSLETRQKIASKMTGRVVSAETRLAMSLAARGRIGPAINEMKQTLDRLHERTLNTTRHHAQVAAEAAVIVGELEAAEAAKRAWAEKHGRMPYDFEPWNDPTYRG